MKLFKKLMVALSVLLVIGMLAACSDGNKSDGGDENGAYTLKYDGITITEGINISDMSTKGGFSSSEYSVSGTTITLNDAGFNKMLELFSDEAEDGESFTVIAIVVYDNEMLMPLDKEMFDMAADSLTEGTDYTLEKGGKIVKLTDTGYQNGGAFFGSYFDDEE